MRIKTLTTIKRPDPHGGPGFDIYHGGLEFTVDDALGLEMIEAGQAIDPDAPPKVEPEPDAPAEIAGAWADPATERAEESED